MPITQETACLACFSPRICFRREDGSLRLVQWGGEWKQSRVPAARAAAQPCTQDAKLAGRGGGFPEGWVGKATGLASLCPLTQSILKNVSEWDILAQPLRIPLYI